MVSYQITTLGNGLRVATAHLPTWRSTALGIFAGAGSRHDPGSRLGLAHFAEHMLFKGTARRSSKRIVSQAESIGGSLNAYTSEEHTCYHIRIPAIHLHRMIDLLGDMYMESVFPDEEIHRERQVIEDEILMYLDDPASHVDDLLSEVTWPRHPLGRPILGTVAGLRRVEREDFLEHRARCYGARNTVISLAGPQSHEAMLESVGTEFDRLARGQRRRIRAFHPPATPPRDPYFFTERTTEQVHFRMAFHAEGRAHPQAYPSRLLSVLLGETMSSRLSQEIREKRGYCYHIGTSRDLYQDTGLFTIYTSFEGRFLLPMLRQILKQLRRLQEKAPSKRELKEAYQFLVGNHEMGLEETATQMFWIGEAALHDDDELDPDHYIQHLAAVTPEAVQQCAREIFTRSNLRMALLGPDLEKDRVAIQELCEDQLP